MALETIHKDSCTGMCAKSELDVFSVPPTQVVMEKIQERCLSYYKYNFLRLNCYEQQIREFTLT
jgi:hypothetical protein